MKNPQRLLKTGIAGTVIVALCCFTPVLVLLLGALGLSALVGYLDIVLLPALAGFVCLTLYALWRKASCSSGPDSKTRS
ncbi:mercury resistance system transport protein MerF [Marinobacterium rhizophilum]|uniref:Mercury resistance system transport protein MerF n=1 Tax=Marinobacterium rhizophilum TaxID=420402 RepID=A0ABY5HL59_9GAMM|nr:mercury resistance system transport protein MerF [Marinobacterium rhizophilum]UTW13030.1 mercury resistance system transport protein MerF [Marinobacterium rhizophilum]